MGLTSVSIGTTNTSFAHLLQLVRSARFFALLLALAANWPACAMDGASSAGAAAGTAAETSPKATNSAAPITAPRIADHVLIEKSARKLSLIADGKVLKTYAVALGRHPLGAKTKQGDGRTPEGLYTIDSRIAKSGFHRALHISYPNEQDKSHAAALGVNPGGEIMIHGIRNGLGFVGSLHRRRDWTGGCIAVTNPEIEEIWKAVPDGTPVEIRP